MRNIEAIMCVDLHVHVNFVVDITCDVQVETQEAALVESQKVREESHASELYKGRWRDGRTDGQT